MTQNQGDIINWRIQVEQAASSLYRGEQVFGANAMHSQRQCAAHISRIDDSVTGTRSHRAHVAVACHKFDAGCCPDRKKIQQLAPAKWLAIR
jgi:hypothetical protein